MIRQENSWNILCELQRQLKKQFFLVQKEQQQKIKMKREIEESIRAYNTQSIQIKQAKAELLKDQGFGNCYNFIKDVIIAISTNIQLGKQIIYLAEEQSTLATLVMQGFYQNIETNDPFLRDITKLMISFMKDLTKSGESVSKHQKNRVIDAWKFYLQKADHQSYFEQISMSTLRDLLKQDKKPQARNSIKDEKQTDTQNDGDYQYSWQVKNKQQLIAQFIQKIQKEAPLCPASIKIPLKAALQSEQLGNNIDKTNFIWQLISSFYLAPFKAVSANPSLPVHLKERILNFVNDLITECKFVSELNHQNLVENKTKDSNLYSQIQRTCNSLLQINEQRYKSIFNASQQQNSHQIQIKILGTSLNLVQLHQLLILLNTRKDIFGKISDKIVHRTQRIFQMSPNLQILKRQKPALQFVCLSELRYEESISSDYYKNYTNVYRAETVKQILKQVLVEIQSLGDYRSSRQCYFSEIFQGIIARNVQSKGKNSLSAQLQMKVRYLIYLLKKDQKDENPLSMVNEMHQQLKQRSQINIKLFQDTKFSLLKVYCNLRNLKLQLKGRQQAQRKGRVKLHLLQKLQQFHLSYCISSKASRNKYIGEEAVDHYRYKISSADEILISPTDSCLHKENIFTGSQFHAQNASKFIRIFANLPEVRYLIGNPSFLNENSQNKLYVYCNQSKIREAFTTIVKSIIQRMKLQTQQRGLLQSILYRKLSQLLLGRQENISQFAKDRALSDKIQSINLEKQGRDIESPTKLKSNRKRRGSTSLQQTPLKHNLNQIEEITKLVEPQQLKKSRKQDTNKLQYEQLVQIGVRTFRSLNQVTSPMQKVRKLKQLIQIYRIVVDKTDHKSNQTIQKLLQNSLIKSRVTNIISTLSFLQIFLPEDKLMSTQGMILKQIQRAVVKIYQKQSVLTYNEKNRVADC